MFYSKYKKKKKKNTKKDSNKFVLFEKWKSICIFMLLFYFEILLQLPTWTFYENVNIDSICKKRKGKKDCRPLKGGHFCYTLVFYLYVLFLYWNSHKSLVPFYRIIYLLI